MNNVRPITFKRAVYYHSETWLLNTYVIKYDENEIISTLESKLLIENSISILEATSMSDEFEYLKTGFAFLHYGRRGINLSIWHWGKWDTTFELYNCSWYCYGRNIDKMELLDSAEPVLSQHEIELLNNELHICNRLLKEISSAEQFREKYIDEWAGKELCYIL